MQWRFFAVIHLASLDINLSLTVHLPFAQYSTMTARNVLQKQTTIVNTAVRLILVVQG